MDEPIPRADLPLTLNAKGVAELLGWLDHAGAGNGARVRSLYRQAKFPGPIDPTLSSRSWRWSRRAVEAYGNGET